MKMSPLLRKRLSRLFDAGRVVFLAGLTLGLLHHQWRYHDVMQWVEVPADVRLHLVDLTQYRANTTGSSFSTATRVDADYTYQVNGRVYEGIAVSPSGSVEKGRLPAMVASVYYNPRHPEDAVVVREPVERWSLIFFLVTDAILAAWGASVLWKRIRRRRMIRKMRD